MKHHIARLSLSIALMLGCYSGAAAVTLTSVNHITNNLVRMADARTPQ